MFPPDYSLSYFINPKQILKETGTGWSERKVISNLYIDQSVKYDCTKGRQEVWERSQIGKLLVADFVRIVQRIRY